MAKTTVINPLYLVVKVSIGFLVGASIATYYKLYQEGQVYWVPFLLLIAIGIGVVLIVKELYKNKKNYYKNVS